MSYRQRFAHDKPTLVAVTGIPSPACVFCGRDDLRVGGRYAETYLSCTGCGADGPVGNGPDEAYIKYTDRVNDGLEK